jgi:methyltransferase (TIGR00027 family)
LHREREEDRGVDSIGATSLGIAFARAQESRRPDRLFEDPYAERFVEAGARMATPITEIMTGVRSSEAATIWEFLNNQVAVRTRYFDDYLSAATAAGIRQVVLIAVGLDARGLRLPWPAGVRVYELDQPSVLEFKERVIGANDAGDRRVLVPVDLRHDWRPALAEAGFDAAEPSVWLIEGLFPALTAEQSDVLVARVSAMAAPGSRLAYDHTGDTAEMRPLLEALDPTLATIWQGGPTGDPVTWLDGHGWDGEVLDHAAVSRDYGRVPGPEQAEWPRSRLMQATRR